MKVELPELKRCCFCIPLRHGLIVWGYIKLVLLVVMFSFVTYFFATHPTALTTNVIVIKSMFILLLIVDTCLTVIFLIGGHQKTARLLYVYYIYNIVLLCLVMMFFTWATVHDLCIMNRLNQSVRQSGYTELLGAIQIDILMGFSFLGVQTYMILLLRSEIVKLKNSTNCRFDNLVAEAQCSFENGTNEQGINYPNMDIPNICDENGADRQYEGIINQTKKTQREY